MKHILQIILMWIGGLTVSHYFIKGILTIWDKYRDKIKEIYWRTWWGQVHEVISVYIRYEIRKKPMPMGRYKSKIILDWYKAGPRSKRIWSKYYVKLMEKHILSFPKDEGGDDEYY